MEDITYNPPGPVANQFIQDRSFVSGLMGPVGSGKSVAAVMKGMSISMAQKVATDGKTRYSRAVIVRNTYPELRSTTIKTWLEWFPEGITKMNWGSPITGNLDFWLPDKTRVKLEIFFLPLDRPEEVAKIRGMELTWGWLNEASEISKASLDMVTQRVGRYPPKRWGGASWSGVFFDTNPPDTDHWIYKIFESGTPEAGYKLYKQPGALKYTGEEWIPNPDAENVQNHELGYEYWQRQVAGKSRDWCKVFLAGQYGVVTTGRPVYPEYDDDTHCKPIKPIAGLPLLIGLDYGLTPAAVICQISPHGQLRIYHDLFDDNCAADSFVRDQLKPFLAMNYPGYSYVAWGDPSGVKRSDTDAKTVYQVFAEHGLASMPAYTNEPVARWNAVKKYLTKMVAGGQPGLLVDPAADMIRQGFNGKYEFKRIQVAGDASRYRDVADKNKYSHPHDALQYAALGTQYGSNADFEKPISYKESVV